MGGAQRLMSGGKKGGILINGTVLERLACAEGWLMADEKEMGCCILDIGGGTTDLAVFGGGVVRHTGTVAIGGDHFTNDLAVGLRPPTPQAGKIKDRHGGGRAEDPHNN